MANRNLADIIANNLRERRRRAGLSQIQLSELSGISAKHISRLESGHGDAATVSTLVYIAEALKCDLVDVLLSRPPVLSGSRLSLETAVKFLSPRQVDILLRTAEEFLALQQPR